MWRSRRTTGLLLLPLLFVASCFGFVRPASRIADPMTNIPVATIPEASLPIVVMSKGIPHVELKTGSGPFHVPPNASFLIPSERTSWVEAFLNDHQRVSSEGAWKLRVRTAARNAQDIEIYWVHDGYRGSGYHATATKITLRYRKWTGPGFGIIAGGVAFVLNSVVWIIALLFFQVYRAYVRRRDALACTDPQPPA